jgi:hypothetical protein
MERLRGLIAALEKARGSEDVDTVLSQLGGGWRRLDGTAEQSSAWRHDVPLAHADASPRLATWRSREAHR